MSEAGWRKFHRNNGIILVWFLALQAVTGLLLTLGDLGAAEASGWFKTMAVIHHEWNPLGSYYRILLALATAAQGLTGVIIYSLIRKRMKKA